MLIEHNNVKFVVDTIDWLHRESRQIAENELVTGIMGLSTDDTDLIADAWTDGDAESESRKANDEVAHIIRCIEEFARESALADWMQEKLAGHDCHISIFH